MIRDCAVKRLEVKQTQHSRGPQSDRFAGQQDDISWRHNEALDRFMLVRAPGERISASLNCRLALM